MIDSKAVMSQVQELQLILHEIHAEKMVLNNRVSNKKIGKLPIESKENLVEQKTGKKMKYFGECPNKRKGHDKKNQVHMIEEKKLTTNVSNLMLSDMVFEANMVDNPKE
ncbi:hypothetical protein AAG906_023403 [Vitis piasezkii]